MGWDGPRPALWRMHALAHGLQDFGLPARRAVWKRHFPRIVAHELLVWCGGRVIPVPEYGS